MARNKRDLAEVRSIFDREVAYVCRSLRRLGVLAGDVEDLAQEVFIKVYEKLDDYDRERPLRSWLFGFAYHVAANHRRLARHRHEVPVDRAVEPSSPGDDPEQATQDARRRATLLAALDALTFDRRSVLVMHDIDGFSATEIAQALDIPVNTAYSRLRLARADLKQALAAMSNVDLPGGEES